MSGLDVPWHRRYAEPVVAGDSQTRPRVSALGWSDACSSTHPGRHLPLAIDLEARWLTRLIPILPGQNAPSPGTCKVSDLRLPPLSRDSAPLPLPSRPGRPGTDLLHTGINRNKA